MPAYDTGHAPGAVGSSVNCATVTVTPTTLPCIVLAWMWAEADTTIGTHTYDGVDMTQEYKNDVAGNTFCVYSYIPSSVGVAKNIILGGAANRWRSAGGVVYKGVKPGVGAWKIGTPSTNNGTDASGENTIPTGGQLFVNLFGGKHSWSSLSHVSRLTSDGAAAHDAPAGTTGTFTGALGGAAPWQAWAQGLSGGGGGQILILAAERWKGFLRDLRQGLVPPDMLRERYREAMQI